MNTVASSPAFATLSPVAQQRAIEQQAALKFLADRGVAVSQRGLAGHVAHYGQLV